MPFNQDTQTALPVSPIRSPQAWSVAVRRPDGEIETRTDPLPYVDAIEVKFQFNF